MKGWALVWIGGCTGPPNPPTILERVTPPVVEAPPLEEDWIRHDDEGDVFVGLRSPAGGRPDTLLFTGLFGDRMEGATYPSACALAGELCVSVGELEVSEGLDAEVEVGRSSWLGDTLQIGEFSLPFEVDPVEGLGGYLLETSVEGSLPGFIDVDVGRGEWNEQTLPSILQTPDPLRELWPPPEFPVVVGQQSFQEFRWNPAGEGEMWLIVRGNGLEEARPLAKDGSALVDLQTVRWTEALRVELWRIRSTEREVDGNLLRLHTAAEQSWCVYDVCEGPPLPSWPARLPFRFAWSLNSGGSATWTFFEDGTWETPSGFGGAWTYDCCTAELEMIFPSGTRYWGVLGADGCVEGEMESWSGSHGSWSGCF